MKNRGWLKLHRTLDEWQWADSPRHLAFYIHLLLKTNSDLGKWHGITIKPGEFITGKIALSKQTGIPKTTLYRIIADLEKTGDITTESFGKFTRFSVQNWTKYQAKSELSRSKSGQNSDTNKKLRNKEYKKEEKGKKDCLIDPDPKSASLIDRVTWGTEEGLSIPESIRNSLTKIYGKKVLDSGAYRLVEKIKNGTQIDNYENYLRAILNDIQASALAKS